MSDPPGRSADIEEIFATYFPAALASAGLGRWVWHIDAGRVFWTAPAPIEANSLLASGELEDFASVAIPGDQEAFEAALRAARANKTQFHHTIGYLRTDGSVGRVHFDGAPVFDSEGSQILVGVSREETAQMLHDEQLSSIFQVRDNIARVLEVSLAPPALPAIPGFVVDSDYRSSEGASTGDFFDLFPLGGQEWGLTIGDVGGHGAEAAAIASAIRYSLRSAALVRKNPTKIMATANGVHFEAVPASRFTTAHYVRIHPGVDIVGLRVATAGHPALLIRRADRRIEELAGTGPMLGLIRSPEFVSGSATMSSGDILVGYTDGVIEARRGNSQFGISRLASFLSAWEGSVEGCAAALHDRVAEFGGPVLRDDMATVMIERL